MTLPTDEQFNAACEVIRARGGKVVMPDSRADWITPIELWRTTPGLGTLARFRDRLNSPLAPAHERLTGPKGRLVSIRLTEKLLAWLRAPGQPGRRLG